ncbi:MAG: EAL domain-containing protein [Phycisphaeraceae bacterium]|nr:EAL domain-containing protein [Phycisphaeraceae bacterium]
MPNRKLIQDRQEHAHHQRTRDPFSVAVLFMDIDNFKRVNDSLGHAIGDQVLTEAAKRISERIRPGDTLARMGGDEFAILADHLNDPAEAEKIADRVRSSLDEPWMIGDHQIAVQVSIGITYVKSDALDLTSEEIVRNADLAMYAAKRQQPGHWRMYKPQLHERAQEQLKFESELRDAIEHESLMLYYQPVVNLQTGRILSAEALVRWDHPKRGVVRPGTFLPVARSTGLIARLDLLVVKMALDELAAWPAKITPSRVAVNISPESFINPEFRPKLKKIVENNPLADHLEIELTEETMMRESIPIRQFLKDLREFNVTFALDDFGTGYSSMAYLLRHQFDVIKIDRQFACRPDGPEEQAAVVRAVTGISESLNIPVIAEGIETAEQMRCLCELGCSRGQGYVFGRPKPARDQFAHHFPINGEPDPALE